MNTGAAKTNFQKYTKEKELSIKQDKVFWSVFYRLFPCAIHRYDIGEEKEIHARVSVGPIELTGSSVQDLSEPLTSHCAGSAKGYSIVQG